MPKAWATSKNWSNPKNNPMIFEEKSIRTPLAIVAPEEILLYFLIAIL
jgi:hypothetical protein